MGRAVVSGRGGAGRWGRGVWRRRQAGDVGSWRRSEGGGRDGRRGMMGVLRVWRWIVRSCESLVV